jgi:excisionase family DNA binding protein
MNPLSNVWMKATETHEFVTQRELTVQTEWLTANEAAKYLKVKPRTLLEWVRQRKVPAHRLSGVQRRIWRFLRAELDAMLLPSSAEPADGRQQ